MKKRLLFIALFITLLSMGQQRNTIALSWNDNVVSAIGEASIVIPQFQNEFMSFDAGNRRLFARINIPVTSPVNGNSLTISNIVYESITKEQLGDLYEPAIPSGINAQLESVHARDDWFAIITLSPIIKDGGQYKRIKSFNYSYSAGASGAQLRNPSDFSTISNSVLSAGQWHRFYVEKSGVYKITRAFLKQMGVNVDVDPRKIKIYGNGGRMLPLLNSTEYPSDLEENAIKFIGEEDGEFNNSDYILFYAEGVDNWNTESATHSNLFADRSYYYVTSYGGNGKRIGTMAQPPAAPDEIITSFDDYHYHERDLESVARLGRKWHGEAFNVNNEQSFDFNIPDIDLSSPVAITISAAARSISATSMAVKANNNPLGNLSFTAAGDNGADDGSYTGTFTPSGGAITVTLTYNNGGAPGSNAWLDYIILQAKRRLRGNGKQFRFRYNGASSGLGVAEYRLDNAAGINEVWDITDIYNVTGAVNNGQGQFAFKAALGQAKQYIAVTSSDYFTPLKESNTKVANQNIKGTIFNNGQGQFQDIDYIIVTPEFLAAPAERLANIHRTKFSLNVKVVALEKIYQEFSSGKQDIAAIRNFVKYVYNNASSPLRKIKYVNLFGDASFDFKDRIPNNTNIVPIFHAFGPGIANYSQVSTFVTDDFFGLMDPNEGRMQDGSEGLDIAMGRMLVSTVSQADEMINKIVEYTGPEAYGRWRNEYLMIADDIDNGSDARFVPELDTLADDITAAKPFVNIRKIYTDAYVQQASAGGQRYPQAKEDIIRAVNYGALVVNYLGHGGVNGLATERIFEASDAQNLTNRFKYPLFLTATCDVTKFDNPYQSTAGEYIYWNPAGGAIAMVTTTRSIFISDAFDFNELLSKKLYALDGGDYPSMAEALRQTKVATNNNFRVVSFVGDPALKLAIPRPKIVLTAINDIPVNESTDVLKSLSYVKLSGRVTDENDNPMNGYNGELAVTVFDKEIDRTTLGNDGYTNDNGLVVYDFKTLGETIFRGNATVTNGQFEFGFVVPRDIKIPVGNGRISFYARRNAIPQDQTGFNNAIRVGGVNENAVADNTPPTVKLYMNEETFISGGITNDSPFLLAFLEDEHGINTASGIGHDIIAILDGDEANPFLLNDYYEAALDDHTKGSLRFPFSNLEKGLHTITFKAWDVYNNLITAEIQFVVVGDDVMKLEKVLNYPNPFVSYTEFWFTHNRPFEPLDVQVQVFTVTGKVVKTINQSVTTDGFLCRDIKWDGRDDFGDRIGKGVYIYKLTVRSSTTNKKAEKYEKLVLL